MAQTDHAIQWRSDQMVQTEYKNNGDLTRWHKQSTNNGDLTRWHKLSTKTMEI
jgi:hypothetical protein